MEAYPECWKHGVEISARHGIAHTLLGRVIGSCHAMMYSWTYAFNRADPDDIARAQRALEETNKRAVDMGGVPWKAEAPAQQEIIGKMDPNMFEMMRRVRSMLDPNGIMNPGNWEEN